MGHWLDGLIVTARADGRVRVVIEADATAEDLARAGALEAAQDASAMSTADLDALPARVERGEIDPRIALRCSVVERDRAEQNAALAVQMLALHGDYPAASTVGEALERAWWDGRFDEDGDRAIGEGTDAPERMGEISGAWLEVAERLAGGDDHERERLALARLAELRPIDRQLMLSFLWKGVSEVYFEMDA